MAPAVAFAEPLRGPGNAEGESAICEFRYHTSASGPISTHQRGLHRGRLSSSKHYYQGGQRIGKTGSSARGRGRGSRDDLKTDAGMGGLGRKASVEEEWVLVYAPSQPVDAEAHSEMATAKQKVSLVEDLLSCTGHAQQGRPRCHQPGDDGFRARGFGYEVLGGEGGGGDVIKDYVQLARHGQPEDDESEISSAVDAEGTFVDITEPVLTYGAGAQMASLVEERNRRHGRSTSSPAYADDPRQSFSIPISVNHGWGTRMAPSEHETGFTVQGEEEHTTERDSHQTKRAARNERLASGHELTPGRPTVPTEYSRAADGFVDDYGIFHYAERSMLDAMQAVSLAAQRRKSHGKGTEFVTGTAVSQTSRTQLGSYTKPPHIRRTSMEEIHSIFWSRCKALHVSSNCQTPSCTSVWGSNATSDGYPDSANSSIMSSNLGPSDSPPVPSAPTTPSNPLSSRLRMRGGSGKPALPPPETVSESAPDTHLPIESRDPSLAGPEMTGKPLSSTPSPALSELSRWDLKAYNFEAQIAEGLHYLATRHRNASLSTTSSINDQIMLEGKLEAFAEIRRQLEPDQATMCTNRVSQQAYQVLDRMLQTAGVGVEQLRGQAQELERFARTEEQHWHGVYEHYAGQSRQATKKAAQRRLRDAIFTELDHYRRVGHDAERDWRGDVEVQALSSGTEESREAAPSDKTLGPGRQSRSNRTDKTLFGSLVPFARKFRGFHAFHAQPCSFESAVGDREFPEVEGGKAS